MTIAYSGDSITFSDTSIQTSAAESGIVPILATVATNALTITLQPTPLQFRSATLGSGAVTKTALASNITLIVPATATLGTINAVQSRLIVLAINNSAVELAVVNIAGGNNLDETTLINTTAIAAGSNTANVIYSTTARTGVPFRVVGYVESTQATAGTWATAPSTVQGQGGNALTAMSSLGYGQTWQSVTGFRSTGTTYYNTTSKPIQFVVNFAYAAGGSNVTITINGVSFTLDSAPGNMNSLKGAFTVPVGNSYLATNNSGVTVNNWLELR